MTYHLSATFNDALAWAADLHRDQTRKGTDAPYISHLLGVAAIVIEHGGGETEAIAALLHDAVEDQGGKRTRSEIARQYGEGVAVIVDGCTDASPDPGGDKGEWWDRKRRYIAHLREEMAPSVLLVSAADKLYNSRAILDDYRQIGDQLWYRFNGGREGTLWYYESLVGAFRESLAGLNGEAAGRFQLVGLFDTLNSTVQSLLAAAR